MAACKHNMTLKDNVDSKWIDGNDMKYYIKTKIGYKCPKAQNILTQS